MKKLILLLSLVLLLSACGEETFEQVELEYDRFTNVSEEELKNDIEELIRINNEFLSNKNVNGFFANQAIEVTEEEKEELEKELSQYEVTHTVESLEITEIEDSQAHVTVVQKEEFENIEEADVQDSFVTMEYVFSIADNKLVFDSQEVSRSIPVELLSEVEEIVQANVDYAQEKDLEGYLSTLAYSDEELIVDLENQFFLFDIEYEILDLQIVEFDDEEVIVDVIQENIFTRVDEGWTADDTVVTAQHTLSRVDGNLKFYSTEVITTEFLN